jgi:hypothetical protein
MPPCRTYPAVGDVRQRPAALRFEDFIGSFPPARLGTVSAKEVDLYLAALDEPKRSTLQHLRSTILEILPMPIRAFHMESRHSG